MKIIFFGDIVGQAGRQALKKFLPDLRTEYSPDLVLANGENMAHGQGLAAAVTQEILSSGIDYLTSGDHAFSLAGSDEILDDKKQSILRPLNWPGGVAGRGYEIIKVGIWRVLLINLAGRVFMPRDFDYPFAKIKELLENYSLKGVGAASDAAGTGESVDAIIIDFHAEATSEKMAMGWFLDGQVSAVLGTHTHVPTADERILPGGSAFILDLGMTGPRDSVLGADKNLVIKRFLTQRLFRLETAIGGEVEIDGVLITIDNQTGLAQKIERIRKLVALD